ncbi:protein-L-isoaspartate(D-aspartate) O-methyltransferase [bacterium]|nr:protein-L-isoaspartate(D-aspartate) O-methyltransferase [bacterium]
MSPISGSPDSQPDWAGRRAALLDAVRRDVARNADVLGRPELSPAVEAALLAVRRHEYVPRELRPNAYANRALPIGHGQTISQPTIVALMTDLLGLAPDDVVLEVGTGSGYQAAVLAKVVSEGRVLTGEIVPELARAATERLHRLGYGNITVRTGDGYAGWEEMAPFAGIMVTAAAPRIPQPLLDQLAPGGRLVMPVGGREETQWLTVAEKDPDGMVSRRALLPVRFVPLTGAGDADSVDR